MSWIERSWVMRARVEARLERSLERLRARQAGQSTVEYALVGALVVIAAAGALTLLGGEVNNVFTRITTTLGGTPSGR